jgi:hypothetical protein
LRAFVKYPTTALMAIFALLPPGESSAVVGGAERQDELLDRMVMVLSSRGGVCSGIVLARDVILTAAHCVTGATDYRVHYRSDEGSPPALIGTTRTVVHPGFRADAIRTRRRSIDLALLRLEKELPARFAPSALTTAQPARGEVVTVAGFGVARERDIRSTGLLRSTELRVIEPFGPSRIVLWVGGREGSGACEGDSGGPLLSRGAVVAVTTWSRGASEKGCGSLTQGILLGEQRAWIDETLAQWDRTAAWGDT